MAVRHKDRVADMLHQFLGEEIRKLRDPRLQLLTVTSVKVAADAKSARVYWSALESTFGEGAEDATEGPTDMPAEQKKEISKALEKASGFLKKQISSALPLRYVPDLNFVFDETARSGSRIDFLLAKANIEGN